MGGCDASTLTVPPRAAKKASVRLFAERSHDTNFDNTSPNDAASCGAKPPPKSPRLLPEMLRISSLGSHDRHPSTTLFISGPSPISFLDRSKFVMWEEEDNAMDKTLAEQASPRRLPLKSSDFRNCSDAEWQLRDPKIDM